MPFLQGLDILDSSHISGIINDDEHIILFEDIKSEDVRGVGLGVISAEVTELS